MVQIFLKTSKISVEDWDAAFQKMLNITANFPLKLTRIESYNGWSPELDKEHLDLTVNPGLPDEYLSFYGDSMSWTSGSSVKFYKNWEQQKAKNLSGEESDENKPVTWFPLQKFMDDGSLPDANGQLIGRGLYLETGGALYKYAVLAIATMLENLLPGRAFLVALEQEKESVEKVVEWLDGHFQMEFDLPVYFDKKRLLDSFIEHYEDPKDAVSRMEHLYRKQFFRNMKFAIEQIGYESTFRFYAETLTLYDFGTFGFSNVIDPWIGATEDLGSTLQLISESKRLLAAEKEDEYAREKIAQYDLTNTLKNLLGNFILWTPQQREVLEHFYTNKEALETGSEDLFGIMRRMMGYRMDICPIVATREELFEAFMYHDPKKGKVFKKIIDTWVEENADAYENFVQKLEEAKREVMAKMETEAEPEEEPDDSEITLISSDFVNEHDPHEQFFIRELLAKNPFYLQQEEAVEQLRRDVEELMEKEENRSYVKSMSADPIEKVKQRIISQVKERRMYITTRAHFVQWIEEEQDEQVLFYIRLLFSLKLYQKRQAYARYLIFGDRKHWEVWRTRNIGKERG